MVGAGLEVAVGLDLKTEAAVARQQVEHVVEETDAGLGARLATVEVEGEPDLGLGRLPLLFGNPAHRLIIADSP